ncbi:hypothetical protein DXG01_002192 [Tephrocybe rancida]|nr:hypothetical protein DXG01_002192 [Tephrocybe rancida]
MANVVVPLIDRLNSPDGGLRDGLGSLSAYRNHVATHTTRIQRRDDRRSGNEVKIETGRGSGTQHITLTSSSVKQEPSRLLSALDNPFSSPFNAQSSNHILTTPRSEPAPRSVLQRVKPEPMEANLPSSPAVARATASAQPHQHSMVSGLVRIKPEVKNEVAGVPTMPSTLTPLLGVSSVVRVKPEAIESQVSHKRSSGVAFNLPHTQGVNEFGQTLPLTADVKRRKIEDLPMTFDHPNHLPATQTSTAIVENIRAKISLIQDAITTQETILYRLSCKRSLTNVDTRRIDMARTSLFSLRRRKDELNTSIPNVSPIKRTLSRPQVPNLPFQDDKAVLPQINVHFWQAASTQQPVASGSNVRLPGGYDEDDENMDVDPHEYNDNLAAVVLQRIGPMIPQIAPLRGAESFDDNGDFHGRGRDSFVGPQAKADDIDKFLIEAGNAEQFDGNAKIDQALEKLGLESQYDLLPGMEVALMPHQTIGVAWMIEKEKSRLKGGCLGDDMGLGKTVQMYPLLSPPSIATLVKNKSEDPICKTSLIIAPMALLNQWKLEIESKTNCNLQCLIYHGSTKPKRKHDLLRYDVILTTYSTMALEWPDYENEMKKAKAKKKKAQDFIDDSDNDMVKPKKKQEQGLLFQVEAIITTFLLRRMKTTMMDGKRLIELPEKTVSLVKLQFSEEERDIYRMVEAGAQANFNRYLKAGTVLKNYTQVLVLLLRLRQICSHPSLIQEGGTAYVSPEETEDETGSTASNAELARARKFVSAEFVEKMKANFKTSALERMEAEKMAIDVLNTPVVVIPDEPAKYKANERPCPVCRSAVCTEKLFSRTAFLPSDVELLPGTPDEDVKMEGADTSVDPKGKGEARLKRLRRSVASDSDAESFDDDMSDFIVKDDENEEEKDACLFLKKRLGKRKATVILDSDDEETPEEREVLFGQKIPRSAEASKPKPKVLASTKMKYMMERLNKLVEEHPDEKTLIVSQWTGCLSLVSEYLTEKGVIHVKYQGDMNRAKRDQAVRVFMSKDKARIMLMSLKCGGVGLNLTRANNVISLDLGWSQAIEAQSFDRLGQTRPVVVQRLVISDTVEDRVLAMQERKQLLADGSLGEGSGKKIGKLSVKELANLFGLDHRGRLLIQN